jgi:hypothetical protein
MKNRYNFWHRFGDTSHEAVDTVFTVKIVSTRYCSNVDFGLKLLKLKFEGGFQIGDRSNKIQ